MSAKKPNKKSLFWASLKSVCKKEVLHLLRNPIVITFAFLFPMIESVLMGYLLNINVRQIETVVYDVSNTQESRQLIDKFANTDRFKIVKQVHSDKELYDAIISGVAKVGIKLPVDYSERLVDREPTSVLVLVDGSNATVATEAVNVSNIVTLEESVARIFSRSSSDINTLPIEARTSVLYNPTTRSANFFLPGLMVFDMPSITIMLLALSMAIEKERGTMEQLRMTPISTAGMALGKMIPYGVLAMIVLAALMVLTRYVYQVPMHGNPLLLMVLAIPYLMMGLGLGILISINANNQMEALQVGVFVRIIPSLYLSGYMFPIESMPSAFQTLTKLLPDRYFVEITRGIILRGAGIEELWFQALYLTITGVLTMLIAMWFYHRSFYLQ
jgi:ABC-2 type transport system permease protein